MVLNISEFCGLKQKVFLLVCFSSPSVNLMPLRLVEEGERLCDRMMNEADE